MNKWTIFALLAFIFASCSKEPAAKPPIKVEVAEVRQQDMQEYIEAIGNIFEPTVVQVKPQVEGILLRAYVNEGDFVKNGDLLFQIDSRPFKQQLDEAEATLAKDQASLELARSTVNRYAEAAKKDFIAPLNFEQYLANLKAAEAQVAVDLAAVEIAKINLDYCTIYSPITGRVGLYNVNPGNLVVNDDPNFLIEIRQLVPIDIQFSLPQKDFQEVQKQGIAWNYPLEVFLPDEENRKFEGKLYFVDNHIDLQTGMIRLKGSLPNEDLQLWPGQYARVRLNTRLLKDALVIPEAAIQIGQHGPFVYKIKPDMTVDAAYVALGPRKGSEVTVLKGLALGDKVVIKGQINLKSGAQVTIVPPNERSKNIP